jgi:hypothetical protein
LPVRGFGDRDSLLPDRRSHSGAPRQDFRSDFTGALETQQYINRVANEIVENRRRTNAEIRHENWLFLTGREEYKNPFTGAVERGTSEYRYRWQNNQGEVLYCDENAFDLNRNEEFNTKEWKRSEAWDRKK